MGDRLGKKDCLCISSTDMLIYRALFWDDDSNGDEGSDPEWILCGGEKQLDFGMFGLRNGCLVIIVVVSGVFGRSLIG